MDKIQYDIIHYLKKYMTCISKQLIKHYNLIHVKCLLNRMHN